MDNFEHLLEAVPLLAETLEAAPGVQLLATSRERLALPDEQLFHLRGLDFDAWTSGATGTALPSPLEEAQQYAATRLFLQSARRVQPDFQIEPEDLAPLADIFRTVGGMPLGIVLAAAWVELLDPPELAAELGQGLDILDSDFPQVVGSENSIRAIFNYAWQRLEAGEKAVFRKLSVFRGGFTLQAAQEIGDASLKELMSLAKRSLLFRDPGGRFHIHELLRQYAAEQLAALPQEENEVRDHHASYYCAALGKRQTELKGAEAWAALAAIDSDVENVRKAWRWAVEQGQLNGLGVAADSLGMHHDWRGRFQAGEAAFRQAAERAAGLDSQRPLLARDLGVWARLLTWQAAFTSGLEDRRRLCLQALSLLERPALSEQDTRSERAFVLLGLGHATLFLEQREARTYYEESLALSRSLSDRWGLGRAELGFGHLAFVAAAYHEATHHYSRALQWFQELGQQIYVARMQFVLAGALQHSGQLSQAIRLLRGNLERSRALGDLVLEADILIALGEALISQGDFEEALGLCTDSMALSEELGIRTLWAEGNMIWCQAAMHRGEYETSIEKATVSLDIYREMDSPMEFAFSYYLLGCSEMARGNYTIAKPLLDRSVSGNRKIKQNERLSWSLAASSYASLCLGDRARARQEISAALELAADLHLRTTVLLALPAAALLLATQGNSESVLEIWALASSRPFVANSRWFEDVAGRQLEALSGSLQPEVAAAAKSQGRALDLWAVVDDLVAKLD